MVSVDSLVQLKLQLFLRHLNKEVANLLGNGVTHIPQHDLEVRVNALSNLFDKDVGRAGRLSLLVLLWVVPWLTAGAARTSWASWASWTTWTTWATRTAGPLGLAVAVVLVLLVLVLGNNALPVRFVL